MATHVVCFDDEIAVLIMQMEEYGLLAEQDKGKYLPDDPPDFTLALRIFIKELHAYKCYLEDHKLARSICSAVHEDDAIIAALTSEDLKAHEDRQLALRLSADLGSPYQPHTAESDPSSLSEWTSRLAETVGANSLTQTIEDDDQHAGPSRTFAERQGDLLAKLSEGFTCNVCHERRQRTAMVQLECDHLYCTDCAKALFIRATHDETLFPPRCCKKPINAELIRRHMTADELEAFDSASVEFVTINRVYCSNRQCGKFILPALIDGGTKSATCNICGTCTCCICNNTYHEGSDCPKDPALHDMRGLALANGWQTCPGCNMLVQLRTGCNHMTCRCKTEFCYVCGVRWKNCRCAVADEGRMIERAEEVVDRDAEVILPRAERNRRIRLAHAELQENHECDHPGRFQRLFGSGNLRFRCEMCDVEHRNYILQCRGCYINVCEDCRRNRI